MAKSCARSSRPVRAGIGAAIGAGVGWVASYVFNQLYNQGEFIPPKVAVAVGAVGGAGIGAWKRACG